LIDRLTVVVLTPVECRVAAYSIMSMYTML